MKVHLNISAQNSSDWTRFLAKKFDSPSAVPDYLCVDEAIALGDLAEPLGFDGIWTPEHFGTPYVMTPNPLQTLAFFAGRTERISFGTIVCVLPWWSPIRLAHQIAYLDIISRGRFETIGIGRGVAKTEFDAVGIPREESRDRFDECLDILELALTRERFSYEGKIFHIPETSIRPQPRSRDLMSRVYGASATGSSLEILARRGLKPIFVGNKPLSEAANDVRRVNTVRREVGLPPAQSKNILFMYCAPTEAEARAAVGFVSQANRDVALHYGFHDPVNFEGVKGYEDYAAGSRAATSLTKDGQFVGTSTGYDESNLLIGTPEQIIERLVLGQKTCSFAEICIAVSFGDMPFELAEKSLRLFAREVLPFAHKMESPLHPDCAGASAATAD
jgi:alkanesulfonate monooxygenase SsuD/methylene tetrahydromethanopterin reductase-like flavin-dependent oxidoreductase (luciferase family)